MLVVDRLHSLHQMMMKKGGRTLPWSLGVVNEANFMAEFFTKVDQANKFLAQMQTNCREIARLHNAILSSAEQNRDEKEALDRLMDNIKRDTYQSRAILKEMQREISQSVDTISEYVNVELRIKQTQHAALLYKFSDIMTLYNLSQVQYRERCKGRIKRQLQLADKPINDDDLEVMLEQDEVAIFTQEIVTETEQARRSLADVEARHNDILKLDKSIRELHEVFLDLSIVIESQGDMVNRIDHNVLLARDYVEKAVVDTQKAVLYQSQARKKKVIILLVIGLLLAVLIAAILGGVLG